MKKILLVLFSLSVSLILLQVIFNFYINQTITGDGGFSLNGFDPEFPVLCHYHPVLGFAGIPGLRTSYLEKKVVHNSIGFRDEEIEAKGEDEKRIVLLGDSQIWGFGLALKDTIGQQIEEELLQVESKYKYRVINAGVVGYSSVQIYLNYLLRREQFKSDIVIWSVFPNDSFNNMMRFEHGVYRPIVKSQHGKKCIGPFPTKQVRGFYKDAFLNSFYSSKRSASFGDLLAYRHIVEIISSWWAKEIEIDEDEEAIRVDVGYLCNKIQVTEDRIVKQMAGRWIKVNDCEDRFCEELIVGRGNVVGKYYQGMIKLGTVVYPYRVELGNDFFEIEYSYDGWVRHDIVSATASFLHLRSEEAREELIFERHDQKSYEQEGEIITVELIQKAAGLEERVPFLTTLLPSKRAFKSNKKPYLTLEPDLRSRGLNVINLHRDMVGTYFSKLNADDHLSAKGCRVVARRIVQELVKRKLIQ